ncbi:zinc-finger homeodomain protein 2 [Lycium barbarum]|uniref:zinc-finger homeodomain protein 2 n=1 Tax=Lycium barbarum TaxID=112863 RepID=UPI00293E7B45|nr:zinc-finger homeodomain protein 2 [Lycium barbarum]
MEDRDQEKDMGMPNSMSNINPSQHESSSSHQEQRQLNSHQQVEKDPNSDPDPLNVAAAKTVQLRQPQSTTSIRYRECLKNHAVNMGGHVLDGCGEFMPTGKEGTPQALKCAACDCHRNFHRKETKAETIARTIGPYSTFPTMQINKYFHGPVPAVMMNFRANKYIGSSADESSSEDLVNLFDRGGQVVMQPSNLSISKKRFRTKFSQEQKEKMHEFAEKLGWRIQKEDEQQLQQFCNEVGVKRQVFKVWMHNSKQANKKKSQT